jgi:uncharacterized protein (DUF2235 family)
MKVIVFCADGTWDGAENGVASNVLKLFNALSGRLTVGTSTDAEQERQYTDDDGSVSQVAKYIHGVGNSSNWLNQALGGGVGTGLVARLLRGYTYLSRNYAPGDAIVLNGFSRGSYTARALGGFVKTVGLLDWQKLGLAGKSNVLAYQYAASAWYRYQQQRLQGTRSPNWFARLQLFVAEMPQLAPGLALKPVYIDPKTINLAAIGVWDTVGALGIPELTPDHDSRLDLLRFVDTQLTAGVKGFHAVAADEQRVDFTPTLWDCDPPRVTQCLFPGAHADVGGGYPQEESQLSEITLSWMIAQLNTVGVRFTASPAPSEECATGPMHLPWTSPGFSLRPVAPREFPSYTEAPSRIPVAKELRSRLGRMVNTITATTPPVTKTVPYFPLALVNAGYLNTASLQANP